MNDLTAHEQKDLKSYEDTIERGLQTFVEGGNALLAIRDQRLYRQNYSTFEEYCQTRWGMSRTYAHRNIEAAKVAKNLLPIGNIPGNESQARPLTSLTPEQQREAWQEGSSYRAIAEAVGVGEATAYRVVRDTGVSNETPETITGTDGEAGPLPRRRVGDEALHLVQAAIAPPTDDDLLGGEAHRGHAQRGDAEVAAVDKIANKIEAVETA